jgi:hypothetical protein
MQVAASKAGIQRMKVLRGDHGVVDLKDSFPELLTV